MIGVRPDMQGKGIGRAMIDYVADRPKRSMVLKP